LAQNAELERLRRQAQGFDGQSVINRQDDEMLNVIESRRREHAWPIKTHKVKTFASVAGLNKLRKYNSNRITHTERQYEKTDANKKGRKTCAMCSSSASGRVVRQYCSVCCVPLCTKVKKDGEFQTSCWSAWHTCDDLAAESKRRAQELTNSRSAKKTAKGGTSGATAGAGAGGNDTAQMEEAAAAAGGADDDGGPNDNARKNLGASMEAAVAAGGVVDAADGDDANASTAAAGGGANVEDLV